MVSAHRRCQMAPRLLARHLRRAGKLGQRWPEEQSDQLQWLRDLPRLHARARKCYCPGAGSMDRVG